MTTPNKVGLFNPDSLRTLCADAIALDLSSVAKAITSRDLYELHSELRLPAEITEAVISAYTENGLTLTDKVLHMLRDTSRVSIEHVDLSNSLVTDWGLRWLSNHPISRIDISNCEELQSDAVDIIKKMSSNLEVLVLGSSAGLFLRDAALVDLDMDYDTINHSTELSLATDSLYHLSIPGMCDKRGENMLRSVIEKPLPNLQMLDISECHLFTGLLSTLSHIPNLRALILHQVLPYGFNLFNYLNDLSKLSKLRHLDISLSLERRRGVALPSVISQDKALSNLLDALPCLTSLDISGTHLAGVEPPAEQLTFRKLHVYRDNTEHKPQPPIRGLAGRHLEFLGLMNCLNSPCSREGLPATRVTGTSTVEQILECLRVYERRSNYCNEAVSCLYRMLKDDADCVKDKLECLSLICRIMRRHCRDLDRQISGSATMFYLIRTNQLHQFASRRQIRIAVRALYDAMDNHFGDKSMLRNGLLTLCHFTIPEDVLFIYKDVVSLLLQTIRQCDFTQDEFIQRIAIYILNSVVCRVDKSEKLLVGDEGAVRTMLWLIKNKLELNTADEILEMAWSTLWNITDETSENCHRFLDGEDEKEGLTLFLLCYYHFCDQNQPNSSDSPENNNNNNTNSREALLRNMMGLLGNVAEVRLLRRKFLEPKYLTLFKDLLESTSDGIEVSYNAAGIICHLASDTPGHDEWCLLDEAQLRRNQNDMRSLLARHANAPLNDRLPMIDLVYNNTATAVTTAYDSAVIRCASMENSTMSDLGDDPYSSSSVMVQPEDTESTQSRQTILHSLVQAINKWDLNSQRSINYRSFRPIFRLLECSHTVEVRHWAVWALCNLTTVYPEKYCALLKEENGIPLIMRLARNHSTAETTAVIHLANETLDNYNRWYAETSLVTAT